MRASQDAQLRLLDLQTLDSTLDRLAHRRRTLPEIARATDLSARMGELQDDLVVAETSRSDLERDQRKAETDVEQVRSRGTRDQQRLDAGTVASAKELESLQSEIASLHKRQSELEDVELEIMERLEGVAGECTRLAAERDELRTELAKVETDRDAALGEIDAEAGQVQGERELEAKSVPDDLRGLYEKLRGQFDGIGAAPLEGTRCGGCHLTLNPADLALVRSAADDEVVRCEECRRILIRGRRAA